MGTAGRRRHRLFEKICLEGFPVRPVLADHPAQAREFPRGLRWFRLRPRRLFTEKDVERLLQNAGIIRHRGKIVSTINNARRARELADEAGSLAAWFWKFEPQAHERPQLVDRAAVMAMPKTATSTLISKELKKRGWSFVGPTTVYAFMQAMGMVNDHIEGCVCRPVVELERKQFKRP